MIIKLPWINRVQLSTDSNVLILQVLFPQAKNKLEQLLSEFTHLLIIHFSGLAKEGCTRSSNPLSDLIQTDFYQHGKAYIARCGASVISKLRDIQRRILAVPGCQSLVMSLSLSLSLIFFYLDCIRQAQGLFATCSISPGTAFQMLKKVTYNFLKGVFRYLEGFLPVCHKTGGEEIHLIKIYEKHII